MKKINMETKWNEMKEVAKSLGINPIGKKKEAIIEMVNAKIEEETKKPAGKWYEEEGVPHFEKGQVLEVCNREFLGGRRLVMEEYSRRTGFIRGYMIDPKTGGLQKTLGSHKITQVKTVDMSLPAIIPSHVIA